MPLSGLLLVCLRIRVECVKQHAQSGVLNEVVPIPRLIPPTSVSILVVCGLDVPHTDPASLVFQFVLREGGDPSGKRWGSGQDLAPFIRTMSKT
jgi:hypothetical protein